jgi:hypothetical protein
MLIYRVGVQPRADLAPLLVTEMTLYPFRSRPDVIKLFCDIGYT